MTTQKEPVILELPSEGSDADEKKHDGSESEDIEELDMDATWCRLPSKAGW